MGGPAIQNKLFWFTDFQGDRQGNGGTATEILVPTAAERQGIIGVDKLTGTVTGPYWAQVLSQRLGYTVQDGEPYAAVLPNGVIPQKAFSPAVKGTIGFIPAANVGDSYYASAALSTHSSDNKAGQRVNFLNKRTSTWSAYYYLDDFDSLNPYGISSFPTGFGSNAPGRNQLATLTNTHIFGPSIVNDFNLSYMRIVVRSVPSGAVAPIISASATRVLLMLFRILTS
jgi:hypothetical protein